MHETQTLQPSPTAPGSEGAGATNAPSENAGHARLWREADGRWATYAPAKLNLGLRVFARRRDGFHPLESWMVPLSLHDTLWYEPGTQPLELVVTGRSAGVPTDPEKNLVGRAAFRLSEVLHRPALGRLTLHKVVPPGGGLGGGSSDAGNVLSLLRRAWEEHIDDGILGSIAADLGSDVPFFVTGEPSLCTGRGELMSELRPQAPLHAVLIFPKEGLSTKAVYDAFDRASRPPEWTADWAAWSVLPAEKLNEVLRNDLESPAFTVAPWLGELRRQCQTLAGQTVHMTGSGSTLFTLCTTGPRAAQLAACLRAGLPTACECVLVRLLRQR